MIYNILILINKFQDASLRFVKYFFTATYRPSSFYSPQIEENIVVLLTFICDKTLNQFSIYRAAMGFLGGCKGIVSLHTGSGRSRSRSYLFGFQLRMLLFNKILTPCLSIFICSPDNVCFSVSDLLFYYFKYKC